MIQKYLTYKATIQRLKSFFFYQLTLLSKSCINVIFQSVIYLESWFSWLGGGVQKTLYLKDVNKNMKEIRIIHFVSKLKIFLNLNL